MAVESSEEIRTIPADGVLGELSAKFGNDVFLPQATRDGVPTAWMPRERAHEVLRYLKNDIPRPYRFLYDLTGVDERNHINRADGMDNDFTVVYQLMSFERNADVRLKVPLDGELPSVRTVTDIWSMANWYERELWDMFGVNVEGHPDLRRILTPPWWTGHALRKDHPARATEMERFTLPDDKQKAEEEALRFEPEKWGLKRRGEDTDFMFLNIGPQHTGTHGVLRLILQLDGEEILDCVPDIGYHHRAKEKMAERQSWHTFLPYTDRVDYLAGCLNEMSYCLSVERLAGIEVPDRVKFIRVMLSELFRISNHLVWYGTFAQDLGQLSPVFYMFTDRERILEIIEAICGGRMHPSWFRIGGVAQDLPEGWDEMIRRYIGYQEKRLKEYDGMVMQNRIFKARTQGVGDHDTETGIEWGVTGPNLRATGFDWDFRKKRPYSGYEQFDFEIPIAMHGDCYDRAVVRIEEMRQSLRIIEQCLNNMPAGPYKSLHPLTTPPLKERTMYDIETLIHHFLNVSWGPVIPRGESFMAIESSKGYYGYYLISDGGTNPYRTRIRTPSFAHMQLVPVISRGFMIADLLAILGSIDFVMADIDR